MKRIDKLTDTQKAMMPIWRDKWIEIGLKTGETDWERAESCVKVAYKKAGLKWHNNIVRVASPIVGASAASIANVLLKSDSVHVALSDAVHDSVHGTVSDAVRDPVSDAVRGAVDAAVSDAVSGAVDIAVVDAVSGAVDIAVGGSVHGSVRVAVSDSVDDAVGGAVSDAVHDAVRDPVDDAVHGTVGIAVVDAVSGAVDIAVGGSVHGSVRVAVSDAVKKRQWHDWLGGQFWVGGWWGSPSFISFFTDVCGLELSEDMKQRADAYRGICESANYIWLNTNFAMICARPTVIHRDDRGMLHHDSVKAITYPDGWGLYCIHGVTIPDWVVEQPELLTIAKIKSEENLEVQRIMIERFGVDKYLIETGAEVIDTDMRGIEGGGARCLLRENNGSQWLVCTDSSTERIYHLSVSKNAKSCRAAHEELSGFPETKIKMEG